MKKPDDWYPWYPTIYRADTIHLSPEQDGIYRRLIDHYMETRRPLPNNDLALARIAGCSLDAYSIHKAMLIPFFYDAGNNMLGQKRCDEILKDQDERSKKHVERSKKASEARWSKPSKPRKNANAMLQASSSDAKAMLKNATRQDKTDSIDIIDKSITSMSDDFDIFWKNVYPPNKGSKKSALQSYERARKKGVTHEQIINGAKSYANHIKRNGKEQYIQHAATWINQAHWETDWDNDVVAGKKSGGGRSSFGAFVKTIGNMVGDDGAEGQQFTHIGSEAAPADE